MNLYRYVANSPTNVADPGGQSVLGKAIKESVEAGSESAIKHAIKAEVRKTSARCTGESSRNPGMSELYQVHHIFCQQFFNNPTLGPWLERLGFFGDAARNAIALPKREAVRQGATRSTRASLHHGNHIGAYYEMVRKILTDIMQRHTSGQLTDEAARIELKQAQAEFRQGLKDGSITLQTYDTVLSREALQRTLAITFGLAVFAGMNDAEAEEVVMDQAERYIENERYYRQKNVLIRYGIAGYYTADSQSKTASGRHLPSIVLIQLRT